MSTGPFSPDWTITDLLQWIGAEDARCHDDRLDPLLAALVGDDVRSTVALVRTLAIRVAADPLLGASRLGEVVRSASASTSASVPAVEATLVLA